VSAITGRRYEESLALLRRAKWNVKTAIVMQKRRLTYHDAKTRLRASEGSIRRALEPAAKGARGLHLSVPAGSMPEG